MRELARLFAIEVCGYSVMSNHLHLVLRNRRDIAEQWSDDEIALHPIEGRLGFVLERMPIRTQTF